MPPKFPASDPKALAAFEALVPDRPGIVRKPMFGQRAAFHDGRMFCGVFGDALVVRLSDPDLEEAIRQPGVTRFEPMPGRAMTGWARLSAPIVAQHTVAARWVGRALDWVESAPPKAAKKRPTRPPARSR